VLLLLATPLLLGSDSAGSHLHAFAVTHTITHLLAFILAAW
jgi:hypothetical protein